MFTIRYVFFSELIDVFRDMFLLYSASCFVFFFFKQKTAYEMRISDWSSDVCSSDLPQAQFNHKLLITHGFGCGVSYKVGTAPSVLSYAQIGRASCRERVCQYV